MPPLNPPPTIQNHLVLCRTLLTHGASSRQSEVTYAVDDSAILVRNAINEANLCQAAFVAGWQSATDIEVVIGPTIVALGDGSNVPLIGQSSTAPVNGTRNISSIPPNCNALVKKNTGFGGRKNRGRSYFPWVLDDADVNEIGVLFPTAVANIQNSADEWLDELATTASLLMVIANRTFNQPLPPHHVTAITMGKQVFQLVAEPLIASQRRRLGR